MENKFDFAEQIPSWNQVYSEELEDSESVATCETYVPGFNQKEKLKRLFPWDAEVWNKADPKYLEVFEDNKGIFAIANNPEENSVYINGVYKKDEDKIPYSSTFYFQNQDMGSTYQRVIKEYVFNLPEKQKYEILHDMLSNREIEKMNRKEFLKFFGKSLSDKFPNNFTEIANPLKNLSKDIPADYSNIFISLSQKLSEDKYVSFKNSIIEDIKWSSDIFEEENLASTYDYLIMKFVSNINSENGAKDISEKHTRFPVEKQIQKTFDSQEDLKEKLLEFPYEKLSEYNIQHLGTSEVKEIELDKVIGTIRNDTKSWLGNENDPERGLKLIYSLQKAIEKGDFDIHESSNDLLSVIKKGDKYYVSTGNHRMAALKALGIEKAPLVVREYAE